MANHRVRFFGAACKACGFEFSMPLLSDFSYGELIFHGERQGVFGFLSSLEEAAWEDVDARLRASVLRSASPSRSEILRLQRVVAAVADPIAGRRLVPFPVCPSCGSRSIVDDESDPRGTGEIPRVTFQHYLSLSDAEKSRRVETLWIERG